MSSKCSVGSIAAAAGFALMLAPFGQQVFAQNTAATGESTIKTHAALIREHLDRAEDTVDALLDWQHVPTNLPARGSSNIVSAPATTLISVEPAQLQSIADQLSTIANMVPEASQTRSPNTPRGDIHAHVTKAQEIAREMLGTERPVATSGATAAVVTIDRTALQRLEVELDAVKHLLVRFD